MIGEARVHPGTFSANPKASSRNVIARGAFDSLLLFGSKAPAAVLLFC